MTPTVAFWIGAATGIAATWTLSALATLGITALLRAGIAVEEAMPKPGRDCGPEWDDELADLLEGEA